MKVLRTTRQGGRLPELKRLEDASGAKNGERYEARRERRPDEEGEERPEHDIQDSAGVPAHPGLRRARVELGGDAREGRRLLEAAEESDETFGAKVPREGSIRPFGGCLTVRRSAARYSAAKDH